MATFKAVVVEKADGQTVRTALIDENLMDVDVAVAVEYSTLNYKGRARAHQIARGAAFPDDRGIDFAGTVEFVASRRGSRATSRILNGWAPAKAISAPMRRRRASRATAAAREHECARGDGHRHGGSRDAVRPGARARRHCCAPARGSIVVRAAGGVCLVAVVTVGQAGYHVIALTGRPAEVDHLWWRWRRREGSSGELAGQPRARQGAPGAYRRGRLDHAW